MIKSSPTFEHAMQRLNPGQRQAVQAIEGPVLVLAGPGTGKTDVLSLRIGNILLQTQSSPHNILCLTFTETATTEMRARLIGYIGQEAENVHIHTFHSFCNRVIQENKDQFSGLADLEPITELEKVELIEKILDEVSDDSPFKRWQGNRYTDRYRLSNFFDLMKQEGWTIEFMSRQIKDWIKEARMLDAYRYKRAYRQYKKGDLKEKKFKTEVVDKMDKLQHALDAFEKYRALMRESGLYDFYDMLSYVHEKFREDEDLLLDYQERFQYILVDEFQDTNGIQLAILHQLTDYEQPNVFVVGDDDQAIYRFQGAKVENIAAFMEQYHIKPVLLTENYRSSQKIIDAAESVIAANRIPNVEMPEFYPAKEINAAGPHAQFEEGVQVYKFPNRDQEEAALAKEIHDLHNTHRLERSSVAIIYRKHRQIEQLTRVFQNLKIPYALKRPRDILEEPLIQNILMIMEYLRDQYLNVRDTDHLLFRIMYLRCFDIPPRDIAKIAFACRPARKDKDTEQRSSRVILRDLLTLPEAVDALQLKSPESVRAFSETMDILSAMIVEKALPDLYVEILHHTGILKWILRSEQRWLYLQLLQTLRAQILHHAERQPFLSLEDFLAVIERHQIHHVRIPVVETMPNDSGVVHLLTAHGAKGTQFDRVYMLGCTKTEWEKARTGSGQFTLPGNIIAESRLASDEDGRRLFYVAMTRARKYLKIHYHVEDDKGKDVEATRFITELVTGDQNTKIQDVQVPQETVEQYYTNILDKPLNISQLFDYRLIDRFLQLYELSATDLNVYLECPLKFYFEKVLNIPSRPSEYFAFGSIVHKSLERLFDQYWQTESLTTQTLTDLYREGIEENKWRFTERQYKDLLVYGTDMLSQYGNAYEAEWESPQDVKTEYRTENIKHRDVPLKGFIDKVEIYPDQAILIDYKTGKYRYEKFKRPDADKDEHGGGFWRQMMFYKILLNEDPAQNWNVKTGIMDYVDIKRAGKTNGEPRKVQVDFSEEELQIVSDQIVSVYGKIKNHAFEEGCMKPDCTWCNFIKSEYGSIS